MNLFTGQISAKIDSKGRVFIPASFRKLLCGEESSQVVLSSDSSSLYITIYPLSAWQEKTLALKNLINEWDEEERLLLIQFMASGIICDIDSQGRILIPKSILNEIKIENDVLFVGMIDKFVLWNAETYRQYEAENRKSLGKKLSDISKR